MVEHPSFHSISTHLCIFVALEALRKHLPTSTRDTFEIIIGILCKMCVISDWLDLSLEIVIKCLNHFQSNFRTSILNFLLAKLQIFGRILLTLILAAIAFHLIFE